MNRTLHLGQLVVEETGELRSIRGETASRVQNQRGTGRIFNVEGAAGLNLEVADVTWTNGHRDVRVVSRRESPEIYDRLRERLRLGVHPYKDLLYVTLDQARIKEERWANTYKAGLGELAAGAGVDVKEQLLELGARLVVTRAVGLGDRSSHGGKVCAIFEESADLVPVAAHAMTRIAPIATGITALPPEPREGLVSRTRRSRR
jgi:hypothetical protein